ncbi:hypothetical protein DOTSEDRAFT_25221 [Dothistroma septosporum NZE10]|uniref:Transmembrane protein n=1 Tax=Dothistroma septosporum (strain NZE10 / CBS 128990) TaxID=675120 RepID=M2Y4N9_DOTSN|nr:hypothetical protein DOTSEDRAFT_25221 [Dothistroma septosporum NZE10]
MPTATLQQEQEERVRIDPAIELFGLTTQPPAASTTPAAPPEVEAVPREDVQHFHVPHWVFQPTLVFLVCCLIAAFAYASCTYVKREHEAAVASAKATKTAVMMSVRREIAIGGVYRETNA